MWPILICTVIGLVISVERFKVLISANRIDKESLLSRVKSKIMTGHAVVAVQILKQESTPLTNIMQAGVNAALNNGDESEVQTSMDAVALREIPKLEKRISLINTCANIATLLGLLGTVAGLISAFDAVANVSPDKKAEMLANAIATAMNTTAAGLLGAIPLLALYGYISSKCDETISDIHESSVSTLNFIIVNKNKINQNKSET